MVNENDAGTSGDQHRILANIAFYLSAARSAFAGSFTYQKDYEDGIPGDEPENALREKAMEKIEKLLREELISYLLDEPLLRPLGYSSEQLRGVAGQILQTEILEEKKEGHNYYLKARMVGDIESLTDDFAVLRELEEKMKALKTAEKRVGDANEAIEQLRKEIDLIKAKVALGGREELEDFFDHIIRKGDELYENGRFDEAIDAYTEAMEERPTSSVVFMNRGAAFFRNGNIVRAMEDFDRALTLEPENPLPYVKRGCALVLKGDREGAIEDFSRAIQFDPDADMAYLNRGIAFIKEGKEYEQADRDLERYIERNPRDYKGHLNRAIVLSCRGKYDAALEEFSEAIQLDPSAGSAYYNRGNTYVRIGEIGDAIDDYTRVININGVEGDVYYNRGIAYVRIGELEKGLDDFTRSIESYPLDPETYLRRGWINARLGNEMQARRDWEHAQSLGHETASRYLEQYSPFDPQPEEPEW